MTPVDIPETVEAPQTPQTPGTRARPSPNIWEHPDVYEVENRGVDPDGLLEADYYHPTGRGFEERLVSRWAWLREHIRRLGPGED